MKHWEAEEVSLTAEVEGRFQTKKSLSTLVIKNEEFELCFMNYISFSCHQRQMLLRVESVLLCLFRNYFLQV